MIDESRFPEIYIAQSGVVFAPGTAVHGDLLIPMFGEADVPFQPATTSPFVVVESTVLVHGEILVVVLFMGTQDLQLMRFNEESLECGKALLKEEKSVVGHGLHTLTVHEVGRGDGREWVWANPQRVSAPPGGMADYATKLLGENTGLDFSRSELDSFIKR